MLLGIARYFPYIVIGVVLSAVLVTSYASVILQSATSATPKVTWASNPMVISFSGDSGSGTVLNTFTCNPSTGPVQLLAKNSNPADLGLTLVATPSTVSPCGSSPITVAITATCLIPAAQCRGSYNGLVQVRQPENYRNLPEALKVSVIVS